MTLAAVVLAAGASTRMGRPKALLRWRDRPFVMHTIAQAQAARAGSIVVVQGAVPLPDEALAGAIRVVHEAWADGPLSSLQAGLRAVLAHADPPSGMLVLTVDRPHIQPATVEALANAARQQPEAIWQPRLGDRRGHPILYPGDLLPSLVELCPPQTPRTLLARPEIAARRRQVEVEDPAILDNLDRPEDLAHLPP